MTVCLIEKGVETQHFASPHMLFYSLYNQQPMTLLYLLLDVHELFDESFCQTEANSVME